jgi:hypothetical protein
VHGAALDRASEALNARLALEADGALPTTLLPKESIWNDTRQRSNRRSAAENGAQQQDRKTKEPGTRQAAKVVLPGELASCPNVTEQHPSERAGSVRFQSEEPGLQPERAQASKV